jgi:hypothetical protein
LIAISSRWFFTSNTNQHCASTQAGIALHSVTFMITCTHLAKTGFENFHSLISRKTSIGLQHTGSHRQARRNRVTSKLMVIMTVGGRGCTRRLLDLGKITRQAGEIDNVTLGHRAPNARDAHPRFKLFEIQTPSRR